MSGRGKEARKLVPFGGPSASERPVISFYIHPVRFESLLSRFQLSYLLLVALTLCLGLRDRISSRHKGSETQVFPRENDLFASIFIVQCVPIDSSIQLCKRYRYICVFALCPN